jgi:hypothetical protein
MGYYCICNGIYQCVCGVWWEEIQSISSCLPTVMVDVLCTYVRMDECTYVIVMLEEGAPKLE